MGISSNGQICFGIELDEDATLPWDEEYESEIEVWWREVNGFKPSVEIYTRDGEYVGGVEPAKEVIDAYYEEQSQWDKQYPMPFELVNCCSQDCPQWIVAVPGTLMKARRGYPKAFAPWDLFVPSLTLFEEFCDRFDIEGEPQWWLSSYMG